REPDSDWHIGMDYAGTYPFAGNMDYIRVSNQALSTAYMDTWYENELVPATFATVEEPISNIPDIIAVNAGPSSTDRTSLISDEWFNYSETENDDQISFSWSDPLSSSDDTFYYELNSNATNSIDGTGATTANPYIDNISITEGTNYFHAKPKDGNNTWGEERIFIVKYDKSTPSGGSISNYDGIQIPTIVVVNVDRGADSYSGLSNNNSDYLLEYQSANYSSGSCGAYGSWTDASISEAYDATEYNFTGENDKCYQFRYTLKDNVNNETTYTTTDETIVSYRTITYTAGIGGDIIGNSSQTVVYNGTGTEVTADSDPGYQFLEWSDSSTENPRIDENVTTNLNLIANFELIPTTISIACDPSVTMGTITGTGQSNLTTNSATCNVDTDNVNGYLLTWKTNNENMVSSTEPLDTISSYSPITLITPEIWSIENTASEWGGHLGKDSTIKNTTIWGVEDNYIGGKWINIPTTDQEIISSASPSQVGGDNEILYFGAEIGANKSQPPGSYEVSVTVTAVTL
ncbi:MAG: hypothetical protein WAZ64_02010, partial [Candidatus Moraniibacteriota bacterium]